jgi:putative PIN family toxin of toxin-antitoxin system
VLGTSVVVAGIRSDAGSSRQLIKAALEKRFQLLLSVALALEYEAVLKRPEQLSASGATLHDIEMLLDALVSVAEPIYRSFIWRPMLRDADDDMVLEVAMSGHADRLVTFNQKDFLPVAALLGIEVVTPQMVLKEIRRNNETK